MTQKIDNKFHPEKIDASAFIAPGATVIGNVTIESDASVWYCAVARGDLEEIIIGEGTNVQDGCILHADPDEPCVIGARVTIGHGAIVHAATVEDDVLIGMRATILNGAVIGKGSIIAAGALVTPGTSIPPHSLVMGIPGKVIRTTNEEEISMISASAEHYRELARNYRLNNSCLVC
jgi:carbonic anhydrase/acetyltransferase-like protein (isoleucine patch superfamily)